MPHASDFLRTHILYKDTFVLVLNKPAGLPVHRGASHAPCLEDFFDALRFGFPHPPALAHRLDRDTTGCLILGRSPKALSKLGKLFSAGKIEKTYWAIVAGTPVKLSGRISAPLRKVSDKKGWKMEISDPGASGAQMAATTYRTLTSKNGLSLIECKPKTGRTHQIRVHLASLGCPVLGDGQYGGKSGTMMLHARRVLIPTDRKNSVCVEAPPPGAMVTILDDLGAKMALSKPPSGNF